MSDLFDLPFEEEPAPPKEEPAPPARKSQPEPVRRPLTVSELTARLRDTIEKQFYEVWVEGELSNCKVWNTGHMYFTLKDGASQVSGFMFRSTVRYLKFKPTDGLRVVARGKISIYEAKGQYQLVCEHLEPHGLGALQLAFDQLKRRLQEEGLFDAARKRALPALPRKIGIVTSLEGAAIRDIVNVLTRRHATVPIVIRPARVQGEGAALDIARGIKAIAHVPGVDVVIVGRGGGSIEDLWAFNEEIVARAIALCPVPVISAVGHETDTTIADFVADLRAPTPSAAAEMVVAATDEFRSRIDRLGGRLRSGASGRLQRLGRHVHALDSRPGFSGFPGRVALRGRDTSELSHGLARLMRARLVSRDRRLRQIRQQLATYDLGRRLEGIRTRLVGADGRLTGAIAGRRHRADAALRGSAARLVALSPLAVLARGYAVCWNADRTTVIRDAVQTAPGDRVRVTLNRGELQCEVKKANATTEDTE